MTAALGKGQTHQGGGIEIGSLPAYGDVEMRAGGASGAAAEADHLTALYRIAFLHLEFGKMEVERQQTLSVFEHHEIAFEIKRASQQHRAVIHGFDGSSAGCAEVEAEVRT